jgi:hypothetical protein
VLEDAVVDFMFVAMMYVVEQIKILLFYIECWNVFRRFFFSSHPSAHPIPLPVLSQKRKLTGRNTLITKERQKSEKNIAIHRFSYFKFSSCLKRFLSLLLSICYYYRKYCKVH